MIATEKIATMMGSVPITDVIAFLGKDMELKL